MPRNTRLFSDIDMNFTANPVTGDIMKKIDYSSISQSIQNILLTNHYEKPFRPDFGSNIRKLLFENIDLMTASILDQEIRNSIKNYEPRVLIENLQILPDYENNWYTVNMTYSVVNLPGPVTINFFLKRVR
jgi:phage baseplate assembly protein W